jgi:hypothetical protein
LEQVPSLITPGLDGAFVVAAMQPGSYELKAIKALDALRSPGGVFALGQEMFMMRDTPDVGVEVVSGQQAMAQIDVGEKPIDGPTAQLSGSLTIDGRLSNGNFVTVQAGERRFSARTDERGRFEIGTVPAAELAVSVMANADNGMFAGPGQGLWSSSIQLAAGEVRELTIEIMTSSIAGACYLPDGSPAAGVFISASGQVKSASGGRNSVWAGTPTDAQGAFRFPQVAEGTWTLSARGRGESSGRGTLPAIEVQGGVPVAGLRFQLQRPMVVKGRLDLAVFGDKKPRGAWLGFRRLGDNDGPEAEGQWADSCRVEMATGAFSADDLTAGRYRLDLNIQGEGREWSNYEVDPLVVPPGGLDGVVLRVLQKRGG